MLEAYGFDSEKDILTQLLGLNLAVAAKEDSGEKVQAPSRPEGAKGKEKFVTNDCARFES